MEGLTRSLAPDDTPPCFYLFSRMIEEPFTKVANAYAQQHDSRDKNPVVFLRSDIASSQ